jgi:hypothetical protein
VNFETPIELKGPLRAPRQMLDAQIVRGDKSLHDSSVASSLGLSGAPIEAPTHFSQFDPLAARVWGNAWFERGCISSHFRSMVVEGEFVQAFMTTTGPTAATIQMVKTDGTVVLDGTASIGPDHPPTELDRRLASSRRPENLFIVDQMEIGTTIHLSDGSSVTFDDPNGPLYPFSLSEKIEKITEPHPWYTSEGAATSPWQRPIVPMEMLSVLANKVEPPWPVRGPSIGLFLDLEIRIIAGPIFVGEEYRVDAEIVGLSESKRTESYWTLTTLRDRDNDVKAQVLLHSGVFKASYAEYPRDRLL